MRQIVFHQLTTSQLRKLRIITTEFKSFFPQGLKEVLSRTIGAAVVDIQDYMDYLLCVNAQELRGMVADKRWTIPITTWNIRKWRYLSPGPVSLTPRIVFPDRAYPDVISELIGEIPCPSPQVIELWADRLKVNATDHRNLCSPIPGKRPPTSFRKRDHCSSRLEGHPSKL